MSQPSRGSDRRWLGLLLAPLLLALGAGCQNFKDPPDNNLASVIVTNRTPAQISGAVQTVFATHYFQGGPAGVNRWVYQRPGSRMDNLAYANFFFNQKVTVRVTVNAEPVHGGRFLLSCNAALVEDASDPAFRDSHQVRSPQKGPYQQLLKEIQTQLGE
jgi:hypothetical protein